MGLFGTPRLVVTTATPQPDNETLTTPEYDEDGRLYVWRFPRVAPERRTIDRDRIFEYVKKRRPTIGDIRGSQPFLPTESVRRFNRDLRNSGEFFEDVRDLQTHTEIRVVRGAIEQKTPRLRAG